VGGRVVGAFDLVVGGRDDLAAALDDRPRLKARAM